MFSNYLPLLIIVGSNVVYHICAKGMPSQVNPLAVLVVTYLVGALFSLVLFHFTEPGMSFLGQAKQINWAPLVMGLAIVGLEFGTILMYRVGWNISLGALVSSCALAIVLIVVGLLFYKEHLGLQQLAGIALCLVGLILINK